MSKVEEDSTGLPLTITRAKPAAIKSKAATVKGSAKTKGKGKVKSIAGGNGNPRQRQGITLISLAKPARPKTLPGAGDENGNGNRNGTAGDVGPGNGKKLHNKVKNEKELRIDTKRRVKGWLKDIGPEAPEPPAQDSEGLPIYK